MKLRPLGRSGLQVPPVIFGGNVFGWTVDEAQSFRLLDALYEAGLTAIDTADTYSAWAPGHKGGESEEIIGRWIEARGNRAGVLIASKVGMRMGDGSEGLSPAHIERSVEASLRRLRTDYIDLYQAHIHDATVPLEETLAAFDRLVKSGKVRAIGCSNHTAEQLQRALDTSARNGFARYESVQPQYNLIHRHDFEGGLSELCEREEIGAISYFGLAAGFLTGKYRSENDLAGRSRSARVRTFMTPRNLAILDVLLEVSAREGASPAAVAIAWLLTRPNLTAPIVSATSIDQIGEIQAAIGLRLSAESVERLDQVSA